MCVTCGCGHAAGATLEHDAHEHVHADGTRHSHAAHASVLMYSGHGQGSTPIAGQGVRYVVADAKPGHFSGGLTPLPDDLSVPGADRHTVALEAQVLGKNQLIADRIRDWFAGRAILALNLMSSPGAGKTTLLETTLRDLQAEMQIAVVEGDQATSNDAERIRATGVRAVQINTGTGCHLEAEMLERALQRLAPARGSLLLIENVGNLVCPALFDLGERSKVVIFSVTEGEDKPLKYPHMFAAADVLLLSKIDLLPHLQFDVERAVGNALTVNPNLKVLEVSARSGEGLAPWYAWLRAELVSCAEHPRDEELSASASTSGPRGG